MLRSFMRRISSVGFKKCRDNRICVLEIIGENNERRSDIVDKDYAEMHSSEVRVTDIYSQFDRNKKFKDASCISDNSYFKVGDTPNNDDISYFLSEDAARRYNYKPSTGKVMEYYDDGALKSEYYMVDNKKHGTHTTYYMNGEKISECSYINDKKTGRCQLLGGDGSIQERMFYVDGKLHGKYEKFGSNGMDLVGHYKHGMKHGKFVSYDEFGQKEWISHFFNDELNGVCEAWYKNGERKHVCNYSKDVLDNKFIAYHENGKMAVCGWYIKGKLNGDYKSWYDNGNLMLECCYYDDKLHGEYILYDENGDKKIECYYETGQLINEFTEWCDNSELPDHWVVEDDKVTKLMYRGVSSS